MAGDGGPQVGVAPAGGGGAAPPAPTPDPRTIQLRREVFDLRLSMTLTAKQLVYEYVRGRVAAGACPKGAIVVSIGGRGERRPHVDLQCLEAEDLKKVAGLISTAT